MVLKLNEKKQYEQELYTGEYNYDKVKEFLEPFALEKKVKREDSSKDDDNDSQETESSVPDLKPKDFDKLVLGQEKMVLIHAMKNDAGSSFSEIRKKFGSMIEYYELKCIVPSNDKFAQETLEIKKYPSLRLYLPGLKKTGKHIFDANIDVKDFQREVSDLVEDNSVPLNEKDLQMFMSSAFQEEKIPAVLFHNTRETFITFRVISHLSKFNEKIKFFRFRDASPKVLKDFNINQTPKFVLLVKPEDAAQSAKGSVQIAQYTGRFNYKDMTQFIESVAKTETEPAKKSTKRMKEIKNQEDFEKLCMKTSICFLGFFDAVNNILF